MTPVLWLLVAVPDVAVFGPESAPAATPIDISIRVRSVTPIDRVVGRLGGRTLLATQDESDLYRMAIPGDLVAGDRISVEVEATDTSGASSVAYARVRIESPPATEPEPRGLANQWWFWSLLGVAVLGAIAVGVSTSVQGGTTEVVFRVRPPD